MANKLNSDGEELFDVDEFFKHYQQEPRNYEKHKELEKYRRSWKLKLPPNLVKKMGKRYV